MLPREEEETKPSTFRCPKGKVGIPVPNRGTSSASLLLLPGSPPSSHPCSPCCGYQRLQRVPLRHPTSSHISGNFGYATVRHA